MTCILYYRSPGNHMYVASDRCSVYEVDWFGGTRKKIYCRFPYTKYVINNGIFVVGAGNGNIVRRFDPERGIILPTPYTTNDDHPFDRYMKDTLIPFVLEDLYKNIPETHKRILPYNELIFVIQNHIYEMIINFDNKLNENHDAWYNNETENSVFKNIYKKDHCVVCEFPCGKSTSLHGGIGNGGPVASHILTNIKAQSIEQALVDSCKEASKKVDGCNDEIDFIQVF